MDTTEDSESLETVSTIFHEGNLGLSFDQIVAKSSLLLDYDLPVTLENIVSITDLDSQRVLVKDWQRSADPVWNTTMIPQRVLSTELDHEIFVFYRVFPTVFCYGWVGKDQVEQHDKVWQEDRWGEQVSYYHPIYFGDLAPLPEHFLFMETCQHFERWGGLWDDSAEAFRCFGCDRLIHERGERERVRATSPPRHSILTKKKWAKRPRSK